MVSRQATSTVTRPRPTVFIGSSSEGRGVAEAIQANLDSDCKTRIWDQGAIQTSKTPIEALAEIAPTYDFAILVITPDDVTESRGTRQECPRDNVVCEIGLFIGALGRLRTFLVVEKNAVVKLPSDLAGVTCAKYAAPNDPDDLQSALGTACFQIKNSMRKQMVVGPIPQQLFTSLIALLRFAKNVHTSFQALDASHLDSLAEMVYDLTSGSVRQPLRTKKCMDCSQAWNRYSAQFVGLAASFGQYFVAGGWNEIDSAFDALQGSMSADVIMQMEASSKFCDSIKELLRRFMEDDKEAHSFIGRESLLDLLNWPGQDQRFWGHVDKLSKTAKSLITNADAMIVNLVDVISVQQVTK